MRIIQTIILSLLLTYWCTAQQYPILRNVEVRSLVNPERNGAFYDYSYTVANNPRNSGSINRFEIDISRPPGTIDIDTMGLRFEDDGFTERSFRRDFPFSSGKIVPVGFLVTPEGKRWVGGLTNNFTACFFDGVTNAIPPGESLGEFTMLSKGLPAIRQCILSPFFDVDSLFPSIDDPNRTISIAQMDSIREAAKFRSRTIGPTAPPQVFDASIWIDTLLSYTSQSVDLGWLGTGRDDDCDNDERPQDGIEKNLERRLMMAQRDLQRGDSIKARRDLGLLVNKVDRIWKRGQMVEKRHEHDRGGWWQQRKEWVIMTSEAYALLKYNAEYLIDRLPEKESHGKKPGKEDKD